MFEENDNHNPYDTAQFDGADPYDYDYQPFSQKKSSGSVSAQSTTKTMMDEESRRLKTHELARREAELDKRESELDNLERSGRGRAAATGSSSPAAAAAAAAGPKKNFPICYPVVYHSIKDIEGRHRKITCLLGFIAWIALSVVTLLNLINALITIFSTDPSEMKGIDKVQYLLFASIFAVLACPIHFALAYWPLYKAMSTAGIGRFIIFFIAYAFPIFFCAFGVTGWYTYGVSGIITLIACLPPQLNGNGKVAGFVTNFIMTTLWLVLGLLFLAIYINAVVVFRMKKHTVKDVTDFARGQVTRGVGSAVNTVVRTGLSSDASNAI